MPGSPSGAVVLLEGINDIDNQDGLHSNDARYRSMADVAFRQLFSRASPAGGPLAGRSKNGLASG